MVVKKTSKVISFIALALIFKGCAAAPVTAPVGEILLKELCEQNGVDWEIDSVSQVVTMQRGGVRAKAMIGSALVIIGEEKINLSVPLRRKQSFVIVPVDFKRKVIDQLARRIPYETRKFKKVIIDPGHGGKDPGTIGRSGLKEKTVVLDIAQRFKKELEEAGIKVTMTRGSDEFIPLEDRARMANRANADLFISVHANASRARSVQGLEIYYLRNLDKATWREIEEGGHYRAMFRHLSMRQGDQSVEHILLDMLYTNKQVESRKLARYMTKNTSNAISSMNRGVKSAGFFVLKNTVIPAILVEVGFLSNKEEEKLLGTSSYRQDIADGLAKSILEYEKK